MSEFHKGLLKGCLLAAILTVIFAVFVGWFNTAEARSSDRVIIVDKNRSYSVPGVPGSGRTIITERRDVQTIQRDHDRRNKEVKKAGERRDREERASSRSRR